jgi:hypothetical protein
VASDRQIAANRMNALQSRGPKTFAGRAASRRNALKHGLTARSLLLDGENAAQFDALRAELLASYRPQGLVEEQLVDMMAGLLWRLRRVPQLEAAAFAWMQRCLNLDSQTPSDADGQPRVRRGARRKQQRLGRAVFHLVRDGDILDKLNRYETHLILQLGRIAAELDHHLAQRTSALKLPAPE